MSIKSTPVGWRYVKLGEITVEKNERVGLENYPIVLSSTKYYGLVPSDIFFKRQVYSNDISNYKLVYLGWFAYATNHLNEGSIGLQSVYDLAAVSPMYTVFVPTSEVNAKYLFRVLKSPPLFAYYKNLDRGTVERRGAIRYKDFATIPILLPPLPEQQCIVEILDTIDEAIAHTSSLIAKLKQMKAGLLNDLLTRGLDENGELRDAIAHPEQFKDSPLGRIPKDWEVAPLKAKQNPGFPYIKTGPFGSSLKSEHWVDEGVPVITIGSIGEREFIRSEILFISEAKAKCLSAYAVKEGDLVFSRVADVGRSVVVSEAENSWIISSNLIRLSLDRTFVDSTFAYLNIVYSRFTRRQIRQFVNSGGREIANTAVLDSLLFCWASKEEQLRIAKAANMYDSRVQQEETYLNKLKLQKKGLMHDLLTGKVRVNGAKTGRDDTNDLAALTTA